MDRLELQEEYCNAKELPMFAPSNGKCFSCGRQVKDNGKSLITGCDKCNYSFCE